MRELSWLVPVLIVAAVMASRAFQTWVRAKHGYPIEDEDGRRGRRSFRGQAGDLEADRKIALLASENERLTGQISRLEERIAVLERIATDPAERVAREIDSLR
ncbi:hypothetical protein ACQKOH_16865 [Sphingomonas sp. NPDC092331]|jgi:uncharacterized small protein (DUF1192 family)|uniref:hypothetical protein n=2 Tax=unclassified Sphingomonas TaxID=196159 RepID=UPI00381CC00A|nr:hypothetical protein [Sphingomonas sp.]